MKIETDAKLVTVYVNSTDQWHGQSLYTAIVQLCKDRGIAGVTVVRGVEGFGGGRHIHTTRILDLAQNLPLRIDIVDIADRVDPLLSALDGMIGEGLVTVTDLRAIHYSADPRP